MTHRERSLLRCLRREQRDSTAGKASERFPAWWDLAVGWQYAAQPAEPSPTRERWNAAGCSLNITWGEVMKATVTGESGDAESRPGSSTRPGLCGPVLNSHVCLQTGSKVAANWVESATGTTEVRLSWDLLTQLSATAGACTATCSGTRGQDKDRVGLRQGKPDGL